MNRSTALAFALTALHATALAQPALAQNLFAPRVIVNDRAVTEWELQQRISFLNVLRAPGDIQKVALDGLIDDRLRSSAATQLGIEASEEQVRAGMEEFAGRANLPVDEFIRQLGLAGIEEETFRDFISSGVVWREVVRQRYLPRVTITNAEIDRAIAQSAKQSNVRLLLSELILPAPPGQEAQALDAAEDIAAGAQSVAAFSEAARQYSAAPSAQNGGQIEWLALSELPPALQPVFLGLRPGQVTQPLPIPNGVALFQLRAIDESAPTESATEVEYAQYSTSDAAALTSRIDTCDDLYPIAREGSQQALVRQTVPTAQLPQDLGLLFATMDPGESRVIAQGGTQVFTILCARRPIREEPINRNAVRDQLQNQRISAFAEVYLDELRDNAIIRQP